MAWLASLAGAGISAWGSSSAADKNSSAIANASKKNKKGYQNALAGIQPYQQVGESSLNSLAELMGIEGYRTPEERSYNALLAEYTASEPKYKGPGRMERSDFEKLVGFGPAGAAISTTADLLGDNFKILGQSPNHWASPANIPGPVKDFMGAKSDRAAEEARRKKKARRKYVEAMTAWTGRKTEIDAAKSASEKSLLSYDPTAALRNTAGYQSRYSEGLNTAQNSMAGSMLSGNALRGLTEYGQNYASNERDKEYNRLVGMAGLGQSAVTTKGNWAIGQGGAGANLALMQGNNAANYYGNLNNIAQGTLGNFLQYQNRQGTQQPSSNALWGYGNNAATPYGNVWDQNYQPYGTSGGE